MTELVKIGLSANEIRKLASVGITSLKQVSLATPSMIGFGEGKAESIIRAARNAVANDAVAGIDVPAGRAEVRVRLNYVDQAVKTAVLSVLDINSKIADERQEGSTLVFTQRHGYQPQFKKIRDSAKQWQRLLASMQKEKTVRQGITIDPNALRKFAKETTFESFAQQVFQGIVGNDVMKRALALSMFSTFEDPVHTLVIGDPGSSKTLARDIIVGNFSGVTTVGANTTKSGLVCNLSTGEPGALAAAHEKVVLIDEFDKISGADVQACYELLSNGRCSVHSGRVHQDIVSKFVLIAFGNPATATFSGNPIYDIGMESTLLSRFAFVVRTETLETEQRKHLFSEIFKGKMNLQNLRPEFDQWVKLARTHQPTFRVKDAALKKFTDRVIQVVDGYSTTPLRRDLRMGNHARRIALALARAEFGDVTDTTLDKAYDLIESYMRQWDE